MQKVLFMILVLLICQFGIGQTTQDYKKIDKYAFKTPNAVENNISQLQDYLSKEASNDFEKVRSYYMWMTLNIDYDNEAVKPGAKRINQSNKDVLNRKKAVCQGFSNLFQEMCRRSQIPCEVIAGYPKPSKEANPDFNEVSHTWNAVNIENKWYLLDVTWGAGNENQDLETYFLASPEEFILDHLPSDPMWQLLDCPIGTSVFKMDAKKISAEIHTQADCFNYADSIKQFMALSRLEKKLKTALNAYQFNPVEENGKYLASMYMDKVSYLSDLSYEFEIQDSFRQVMNLQLEIIEICEEASKFADLYPHQKENLAYSHFNYAVALSRLLPGSINENKAEVVDGYKKMLDHFEKGRSILAEVPPNFLSENGLKQFDEYIEYVQSQLKSFE